MKNFFLLLVIIAGTANAQKLSKSDKKMLEQYKASVIYLADDKLEGRRTGTQGEKLAYDYIISKFKQSGIEPYDNKGYLQAFPVAEGKETGSTSLEINDKKPLLGTEYFPLSFSPSKNINTTASLSLNENGAAWFLDLKDMLETNTQNPHFDLNNSIIDFANKAAGSQAPALIVYNSSPIPDKLVFDAKDKTSPAKIPVIYLKPSAVQTYFPDSTGSYDIKLNVDIKEKKRTGYNVIGYINNNANSTIVLGAHYDHLGYGEDRNSMHTGAEPAIHNGADDNASGTAALIELGSWLKKSKLKKHNYVLIAFSGEELGLFGSKYYVENSNLSNVNFMINMDMIGRLNDSTRGLNIGGYGTSPQWSKLINPAEEKYFRVKLDSSGSGPSDHTSFYRKDIPVLFFFTGTHSDYHKPSDDAEKLNYEGAYRVMGLIKNILTKTASMDKLSFAKTREAATTARTPFKVSLGIMPDYTYSGNGVKVDGVTDGKAAQKAGIKTGDVIYQLGDYKIADVQSYMEALSKFEKGEAATVKLLRDKTELSYAITF